MTNTSLVRAALSPLFPRFFRDRDLRYSMRDEAEATRRLLQSNPSIETLIGHFRNSKRFRANQKQTEMLSLLKRLEEIVPGLILEIGSAMGGTLALFAAAAPPDARFLSLDIEYPAPRREANASFIRQGQALTTIECDTHKEATRKAVHRWLDGKRFDFLFIDGDHSYAGVKADYEMYSPMVRPGGLIGFHDIHPDYRTRFGKCTENDVGEVPRFWGELKSRMKDAAELIEDPAQDGYGIGVITVE
jgi:predicted O-methyltransferase YrrM